MTKSAASLALVLFGMGLGGCPIYDDDDGCYVHSDCAPGYLCDGDSGACYLEGSDACRKPSDCGANETCSRLGTCTPGACHYDSVGCVRGYICSSESGRWECIDDDSSSSGGEGGAFSGNAGATSGVAANGGEGGAFSGNAGATSGVAANGGEGGGAGVSPSAGTSG